MPDIDNERGNEIDVLEQDVAELCRVVDALWVKLARDGLLGEEMPPAAVRAVERSTLRLVRGGA